MAKKLSPLLKKLKYFQPRIRYSEGWSEMSPYDREWEKVYRRRWQHDKVVRTTHGVNCTGSCSWRVFVKDGIITWENQAVDYPSTGPDMPEYEPRGCPRGATFSWYTYSPLRVKYPYVRGILLKMWREAITETNDPVEAWKSIVEDNDKARKYKNARGKGGLLRASWDEVNLMISASLIYNIKKFGPDRIAGLSPIPAMSMVSYSSGARFLSMLGVPMLSFYDWYADLPIASPQIWGEQTDVPESGDWYNSGYLLIWGSNVPLTRTPDSHFMVEARYRGTKVVSVSPDYAEFVKFADNWLTVKPGTDGALAMAMTHVVLKEFYIDKEAEYFTKYAKTYTDLPFLIKLKKKGNNFIADRFLTASDLGLPLNKAEWKTVVYDNKSNKFAIPNGTIGHRWDGEGKWNLHLKDEAQGLEEIDPVLSFLDKNDEVVSLELPYFGQEEKGILYRSIPAKRLEQNGEIIYIATVFDALLANVGIGRGLSGDYPTDYNDPKPFTPAWQEAITGVDRNLAAQIAREFAQNAIDTRGRSMIIMGAGINQWYNSDVTYRSILNLVLLTGSQGVNGGGWAHYVGQEKVRPVESWQTVAFARDWGGPPRMQNTTSLMYFASDQWRYEDVPVSEHISPLVEKPRYNHYADYNVLAARLGWLPSYPQFNKNSLNIFKDAKETGLTENDQIIRYVVEQLKNQNLRFAIEDPDDPANFLRVLFVWRANLIASSGKGHEFILKHLLGTHNGVLGEEGELKTTEVKWDQEIPEGKLDLLINIDFRMSGTSLYSDIILPAATWYEKYDLSSTDMHPFIHPFNPAIAPPWEARSDWDIFKKLAKSFSELAEKYFSDVERDIVATPLLHDSPDELAQPFGQVADWKNGNVEPIPGINLPRLHIVERDYRKIYERMIALGPLVKESIGAKGLAWHAKEEYEKLKALLGTVNSEGEYKDCPSLYTDRDVAETILTLASTTNGSLALKAWEALEKKTSLQLKDLAKERAEEHLSFSEITAQPQKVITSPLFSGTETGNRRYSPFTTNVERLIPFRTLTGRQHFYLDHEIIQEFGENLPLYKPPFPEKTFLPTDKRPHPGGKEITLRYLTPHYKWSFHSTYGDVSTMLTLFRGGPHVWLNNKDAEEIEVADNEWIEVYNRYGVVTARAVVSHRIPRGSVFMYHSQDRTVNVPISPTTGLRSGTHNSPTKIHVKPTHMIGGYAQLSYGFNYYGTLGTQRDAKVVIRKLKEVAWDED